MQFFMYLSLLSTLLFSTSHADASKGNNITEAKEHEFPFVVSISEANDIFDPEYNHYCTGSLISPKLVLTAAHCVKDRAYEGVHVLVGSSNLRLAKKYTVDTWITYDEWFFRSVKCRRPGDSDIAVITLEKEVDEPHVVPANLDYTIIDDLFGHAVTTVGWGDSGELEPTKIARKVSLKVIPNIQCTLEIRKLAMDIPGINIEKVEATKKYFCTKNEEWALIDEGDSGGPLLDERNRIVGINKGTVPDFEGSKHSKDYINQHQFNIHTSVYFYKKFIQHVLDSQSRR